MWLILTCRCLQPDRGEWNCPSLSPRADTKFLSSVASALLLPSACLDSSLHKSHSKHQLFHGASGGWRELWACACVLVRGGGSAFHAQQIIKPVPICSRNAQFSWDIHWGETNHLHHCWKRLLASRKRGSWEREEAGKGSDTSKNQRKTPRNMSVQS